jgi:hypothetical protein
MNDQKNTAGHLVVWAFLLTILLPMSATSASLEKELNNNANNMTLQPYELFARKDISSASSSYGFVTATTEQLVGVANFDKGKLDTNEIFIFNEIRIGYSTGLAASKAAEAAYETKPSAVFRNAEFEIRQGSRIVLNLPVASLCNNNTGANVQDDFAILGSLCYLRDDQAFTWNFNFAEGVSIPAGNGTSTNTYAEVRLRGHRTVRKA